MSATFGERLRHAVSRFGLAAPPDHLDVVTRSEYRQMAKLLSEIADAIDQDAKDGMYNRVRESNEGMVFLNCAAMEELEAEIRLAVSQDLRKKVERAVEAERFSMERVVLDGVDGAQVVTVDRLDAEPFLERLAEIFGTADGESDAARIRRELMESIENLGEEARIGGQFHAVVRVELLTADVDRICPEEHPQEHGMTVGGLGDES